VSTLLPLRDRRRDWFFIVMFGIFAPLLARA
jgi:hypothetical protein